MRYSRLFRGFRMTVYSKTLLILGLFFFIFFAAIEYSDYLEQQQEDLAERLADARAIRNLVIATRTVYQNQFIDSGLPLNDNTLGFLPAHALSRIATEFQARQVDGLTISNVSDRPRNSANQADPFEQAAIQYFRNHPDSAEQIIPVTDEKQGEFYHYSAPLWVEASCLNCHGKKTDTLPTIQAHYATGFDYQVGEMRGILSIKLPAEEIRLQALAHLQKNALMNLLVILAGLAFLCQTLKRTFITRIWQMEDAASRIAAGDYQVPITLPGNDEISRLSVAFDKMAQTIIAREGTLHDSEERYRSLLDGLNPGVALMDRNFNVLMTNSKRNSLLGLSANEVPQGCCHAAFWGNDEPCADCPGAEAMASGRAVCAEIRRSLPGRQDLILRVSAAPTFDQHGKVSGFTEAVEDITATKETAFQLKQLNKTLESQVQQRTEQFEAANRQLAVELDERKQHEIAMHESQERYRALFEKNHSVMLLTERATAKIVDANNSASLFYGYTIEQLRQMKITDINLMAKDQLKKKLASVNKERSQIFQFQHQLANGEVRDVEVYSGAITITGKDLIYSLVHDISKRKCLEKKLTEERTDLKNAKVELEQKNKQLKSNQVTLIQQEKMATIGQLAAGVAHEINNPMAYITSNLRSLDKYLSKINEFLTAQQTACSAVEDQENIAELTTLRKKLKIDYLIEDGGELINESVEGAERVRDIVQSLKTFSRVDEPSRKQVDIHACLESSISVIWNEVKYKSTLIRQFGELPMIHCFPQQLGQVFINLLVNASQAIEKDGEITVTTGSVGDNIVISIADNGCGIAEENIGKIFDPFFTTKEVGEGTGLGMSIVYEIIKNHHGTIDIDSHVGQGTTFTIKLPISAPELEEHSEN